MNNKAATASKPVEALYARHNPSHVLVDGLFVSHPRRKEAFIPKVMTHSLSPDGSASIEFKAYERLGAFEARLLQVLVAKAGPRGQVIENERFCSENNLDEITKRAVELVPNSVSITVSFNELIKDMGLSKSGSAISQIKKSLENMQACSIRLRGKNEKRKLFFNTALLSYGWDESRDASFESSLVIYLNSLISDSVLGISRYIRIDLHESKALKSDAAILIHQRLCGFINLREEKRVSMDSLMGYVWHGLDEVSADGMKHRIKTIRLAMGEFRETLGWDIEEYKNKDKEKVFKIKRNVFKPKQLNLI